MRAGSRRRTRRPRRASSRPGPRDETLSSRLDHHVAHYTGQDELAEAIQKGLELREQGQEAQATQLLGRAVKIAHTSNNVEMTQRLAKVVDVVDAGAAPCASRGT